MGVRAVAMNQSTGEEAIALLETDTDSFSFIFAKITGVKLTLFHVAFETSRDSQNVQLQWRSQNHLWMSAQTDYGAGDLMVASIRHSEGKIHFSHMHDFFDTKDHKFGAFTLTDNFMLRVSQGSCYERGSSNLMTKTGILFSGMPSDDFNLAFAHCIDPDEDFFKSKIIHTYEAEAIVAGEVSGSI